MPIVSLPLGLQFGFVLFNLHLLLLEGLQQDGHEASIAHRKVPVPRVDDQLRELFPDLLGDESNLPFLGEVLLGKFIDSVVKSYAVYGLLPADYIIHFMNIAFVPSVGTFNPVSG